MYKKPPQRVGGVDQQAMLPRTAAAAPKSTPRPGSKWCPSACNRRPQTSLDHKPNRDLRTHILRLLGPKTIPYKALGLF